MDLTSGGEGGRWFELRALSISFRGLVIGIVTTFVPVSSLIISSVMVVYENSEKLENGLQHAKRTFGRLLKVSFQIRVGSPPRLI